MHTEKSRVVSGRIKGQALAAFETLLQENPDMTMSAAMAYLIEDWARLKAGAKPAEKYATVDEAKFNLALGAVVELARSIRNAQSALRTPRPVLPKDELMWVQLNEATTKALTFTEARVVNLYEAGKIHEVPRPDLHLLKGIARIAYSWADEAGAQCRQQLFAVLKPWLGTPPVPIKKPGGAQDGGVK